MNVKEENICRLCLKVVENEFEVIDEVTKGTFRFLSLKMNLELSKDPIICCDCREMTTKCLDFKSVCMVTEERLISFADNKSRATFNLKDILNDGRDIETVDDNLICRFCLNHLSDSDFVFLDNLMNDVTFAEKLQALMPVTDFDLIKNPVVCTSCSRGLERYIKFVDNCLDVEEKIIKYRHSYDTPKIKLGDVLRLSYKNNLELDNNEIHKIKEEGTLEEEKIDVIEHGVNFNESVRRTPSDMPVYKLNIELKSEARFKCGLCTYETKRNDRLKSHTLIHKNVTELETYKCCMCPYEGKRKDYLKNHMLIHRDLREVETYKCSVCNFQTKRKCYLKNHAVTHKNLTEMEMFQCSMCAYKGKYKKLLRRHMLVHKDVTEVATYKCATCTFETKYKRYLKRHALIHKDVTEVEMFKCVTCGFATKHERYLKKHILIHKDVTQLEMYKCTNCAFETRYKGSLENHTAIHKDVADLKIYNCPVCNFRTRHKDYVKRHIKRLHNDIFAGME